MLAAVIGAAGVVVAGAGAAGGAIGVGVSVTGTAGTAAATGGVVTARKEPTSILGAFSCFLRLLLNHLHTGIQHPQKRQLYPSCRSPRNTQWQHKVPQQ